MTGEALNSSHITTVHSAQLAVAFFAIYIFVDFEKEKEMIRHLNKNDLKGV